MPRKRRTLPILPTRHRRARSRRPAVLGAAAAATTAAAAAALLAARHRRDAAAVTDMPPPVVPGPPSPEPVTAVVDRTWACACGQEYRVRGEDRHRVYWLPDAAVADPVLSPECVACGRPLPREHEQAVLPD